MNNTYDAVSPLVSVIIINFNGGEYVHECIQSIFKSENCNFEVLLIDNNSTDNSSKICKQNFPEIRLFENPKNLAMSARNIGIDNAKGDFILFLDADTTVTSDSISKLIESYQLHGDGLYQGRLLNALDHNIINGCGNFTNIFGFGFPRSYGEPDIGQHSEFEKISFTVGACTFSSTSIIQKIGYIDEEHLFFLMHDDLDYGWRSWSLGIPCYYEPNCIVYHVGSPLMQYSSKKYFYAEKNRWICILSHYSLSTLIKIMPTLLLIDLGVFLFLISKGFAKEKIKASISILKLWSQIMARRKKYQKLKLVSDSQIIKYFVDNVNLPHQVIDKKTGQYYNKIISLLAKLSRSLI